MWQSKDVLVRLGGVVGGAVADVAFASGFSDLKFADRVRAVSDAVGRGPDREWESFGERYAEWAISPGRTLEMQVGGYDPVTGSRYPRTPYVRGAQP